MVIVRIPPSEGNCAVNAVATPRRISATMPSTCSRITMIRAITPTARKPGISRTVCSQPISAPSKPATSMTKLFSRADQVAKATGIAAASTKSSTMGRRQAGRLCASSSVTIRAMARLYAPWRGLARGHGTRPPSAHRTSRASTTRVAAIPNSEQKCFMDPRSASRTSYAPTPTKSPPRGCASSMRGGLTPLTPRSHAPVRHSKLPKSSACPFRSLATPPRRQRSVSRHQNRSHSTAPVRRRHLKPR